MLVWPGFEPVTSRSADRRSPNSANQAAVNLRTVLNSKTGFRNLKWFHSSVALTVSCSWGCEQKKRKTMGTFSVYAEDAGKGKRENEINQCLGSLPTRKILNNSKTNCCE